MLIVKLEFNATILENSKETWLLSDFWFRPKSLMGLDLRALAAFPEPRSSELTLELPNAGGVSPPAHSQLEVAGGKGRDCAGHVLAE